MKSALYRIGLFVSICIYVWACSSEGNQKNATTNTSASSSDNEVEVSENDEPELSELAQKGKKIFEINCAQCHLMSKEVLIGPGLAGATARKDKEWILAFIKNSQKVIQSGDEYAVALYEEYNNTVMTSYYGTDEELEAIYAYLKAYENES